MPVVSSGPVVPTGPVEVEAAALVLGSDAGPVELPSAVASGCLAGPHASTSGAIQIAVQRIRSTLRLDTRA